MNHIPMRMNAPAIRPPEMTRRVYIRHAIPLGQMNVRKLRLVRGG